jgi:hypothetical protein
MNADATKLQAGNWTWTRLEKGGEWSLRYEDKYVDTDDYPPAAHLRQMADDLAKLAALVASHEQANP